MRARKQHQAEGDGDVDQRTRDGDQELLVRLFGNPLEAGDAADRQQRDVGRGDPEVARGEDVAEFMRQHACEQQHQKDQVRHGGFGSFRGIGREENPAQE